MIRRIIINIILAFVIFPMYVLLQGYFGRYVLQDYSGFSGNFWGYTHSVLYDIVPVASLAVLLFVLLPYSLIINLYYLRERKSLNFLLKLTLFFFITIFLFFIGGGGWLFSMAFALHEGVLFLAEFFVISLIFVSLHYWLIDRKTEKIKYKQQT